MTPKGPTRVLGCVLAESRAVTTFVVATDCRVLQSGFEAVAEAYSDLDLLGVAAAADEVAQLVEETDPDVVLIDYGFAGEDAMRACRLLTGRRPYLPVLVISAVLSDEAVRSAIGSGARGYLYKDVDPDGLRTAIRRLAAGESVLDPRVTGRVILWASRQPPDSSDDTLSAREAEVVRRVARGDSNKEIAARLGISQNTVKTYLRRAYKKLDTRTRSAAVALATQRGML